MRVVVRHSEKNRERERENSRTIFHSRMLIMFSIYIFFLSNTIRIIQTHCDFNCYYCYRHSFPPNLAPLVPPSPTSTPCFFSLVFSISSDFHLTFTHTHTHAHPTFYTLLAHCRVVVFSYVCGKQSGMSNSCRISTRPSSIFQCFTVALN